MKQITWQKTDGDRAYPVFRDSTDQPWQSLNKHTRAIGEGDFRKFQALLKQGYEAVAGGSAV